MQLLVAHGSCVNATNGYRCSVANCAFKNCTKLLRLVEHGASCLSICLAAADSGFENLVEQLIDDGVDIDLSWSLCVRGGRSDVVRLLLAYNANINVATCFKSNTIDCRLIRPLHRWHLCCRRECT